MFEYKGYVGLPRLEIDDGVIAGQILGIQSIVTFEGETVAEAEKAFRDSVDDYLAQCVEQGQDPEKPYSGKFLLRVGPDLHRRMAYAAAEQGMSLNSLIAGTLQEVFGARAAEKMFDDAEELPKKGLGSAARTALVVDDRQ